MGDLKRVVCPYDDDDDDVLIYILSFVEAIKSLEFFYI